MGLHHRLAWRGGCSADGCGNLGPVDKTAAHVCGTALLQSTIFCGTGCDDGIEAGRLAGRAIVLSPKRALACAMDYYGVHSRHTRLKGRVVESAGIRSYRERSGPDRWHNRPGVDGVVADKAQTHCPRLERLVPKVLKNRKCLDTYELFNMSWLTHTTHGDRNTASSDPDGHSCIFVARADRPRWFSLPPVASAAAPVTFCPARA